MKIIFLDIDGVLNIGMEEYYIQSVLGVEDKPGKEESTRVFRAWHSQFFSLQALYCLHKIVKESGAKIVISSVWRLAADLPEMKDWFRPDQLLMDAIIDKTPWEPQGIRGNQIDAWMTQNITNKSTGAMTHYAIIDDDSDMTFEQMPYFFQTDSRIGLTYKQAQRILISFDAKDTLV